MQGSAHTPLRTCFDSLCAQWEKAEKADKESKIAEFDLRPPEALQVG